LGIFPESGAQSNTERRSCRRQGIMRVRFTAACYRPAWRTPQARAADAWIASRPRGDRRCAGGGRGAGCPPPRPPRAATRRTRSGRRALARTIHQPLCSGKKSGWEGLRMARCFLGGRLPAFRVLAVGTSGNESDSSAGSLAAGLRDAQAGMAPSVSARRRQGPVSGKAVGM